MSWHEDFGIEHKEFLLARSLSDFVNEKQRLTGEEDVIIVEYPALKKCSVPKVLLQEAVVNLIVARAIRVWKDTDQLLFDKAVEQAAPAPILIYLNQAQREVVETFTGLLPPYTGLRRKFYKFYQMGFTAVGK